MKNSKKIAIFAATILSAVAILGISTFAEKPDNVVWTPPVNPPSVTSSVTNTPNTSSTTSTTAGTVSINQGLDKLNNPTNLKFNEKAVKGYNTAIPFTGSLKVPAASNSTPVAITAKTFTSAGREQMPFRDIKTGTEWITYSLAFPKKPGWFWGGHNGTTSADMTMNVQNVHNIGQTVGGWAYDPSRTPASYKFKSERDALEQMIRDINEAASYDMNSSLYTKITSTRDVTVS